MNDLTSQQTVSDSILFKGIGLHSGTKVRMYVHPGEAGSGITFIRKDISGFDPEIQAIYSNVTSTNLGTTLENNDGTLVATVEHLMAALWGAGIDNAIIEIDGPEVPIMDGSAAPFMKAFKKTGTASLDQKRSVIEVLKPIKVEYDNKFVEVTPSDKFSIDLEIDFENDAIKKQSSKFDGSHMCFSHDIGSARTFGFLEEIEYLQSNGLARGGSLDNAIVLKGDKVLNKNGLRYRDEFVRHKILDCIGDFFLAGKRIKGDFKAYKTGHELNNKLLHSLFADPTAWQSV